MLRKIIFEFITHPYFISRKILSKSFLYFSYLVGRIGGYFEPNKLVSKKEEKILLENRLLKNIYQGKRCFIIGTGSSLNKCDLSLLKNEVTIGLNSIWHHPDFEEFEPNAICFVEPSAFNESEEWDKYFEAFRKKVKRSILFAPIQGRKTILKKKLFPEDRVYYVCSGKDYSKVRSYKFDLTKNISTMQTVAFPAIEAAIYWGCNPIYLLGIDHDWASYRGKPPHCYDNDSIIIEEELGDTSRYPYEFILEESVRLWKSYRHLKKFADQNNIKIFNASEGSFLDVFPQVKFQKLFNEHK